MDRPRATSRNCAYSVAKERPLELTLLRAANALRITPGPTPGPAAASERIALDAVIDVSTGGRLIGVELRFPGSRTDMDALLRDWLVDAQTAPYVTAQADGTAYIELSTADDDNVRSAQAIVSAELAGGALLAVTLPRRGHGYEISYPSGNR